MRLLLLLFLAVLMLAACGTGGLPHSNQVVATVTPSVVTISAGTSVALTGDAKGFTDAPLTRWWVDESHISGSDCEILPTQDPPQSGCPFGYVVDDVGTKLPSAAVYNAPDTPGTYHVTFEATQIVEFDHLSKTATATITVQ